MPSSAATTGPCAWSYPPRAGSGVIRRSLSVAVLIGAFGDTRPRKTLTPTRRVAGGIEPPYNRVRTHFCSPRDAWLSKSNGSRR